MFSHLLKKSLKDLLEGSKGITSRQQLPGWVFHAGDLHQDLAELGRIPLLLAIIA